MTGDSLTSIYFVDDPISTNPYLDACLNRLKEYFIVTRKVIDLNLQIEGTSFQKKVWSELSKIPTGKTKSYFMLARNCHTLAVRAVAKATGQNKVPL